MSGFENSAGLGVYNWYGARDSGKTTGIIETDGLIVEASYVVDAAMIGGTVAQVTKIPAGARIVSIYAKVSEAFVLGGTTPRINIGTSSTESTNGAYLTEAQAEATGTYDLTGVLAGTWAASLAAETTVGFALSGTNPTKTTAGKVQFVVRYTKLP